MCVCEYEFVHACFLSPRIAAYPRLKNSVCSYFPIVKARRNGVNPFSRALVQRETLYHPEFALWLLTAQLARAVEYVKCFSAEG